MSGLAQWEIVCDKLMQAFTPDSETMIRALFAVEEVIADGFQENFYNQVDDKGVPWAPRKDKKPHPLLIKTGKMFEAATNTRSSNHFSDIQGATLITGVSDAAVPYAKWHHNGTKGKDGISVRMPARRVIYATELTLNRAAERFAETVEESLTGF